jgi:hypothetical protein
MGEEGMTGYQISYRLHETNYCPGCGRSHWYVGRITAECAFCATAIAITDTSISSTVHRRRLHPGAPYDLA